MHYTKNQVDRTFLLSIKQDMTDVELEEWNKLPFQLRYARNELISDLVNLHADKEAALARVEKAESDLKDSEAHMKAEAARADAFYASMVELEKRALKAEAILAELEKFSPAGHLGHCLDRARSTVEGQAQNKNKQKKGGDEG
jgi:hypothetical protein